MDNIFDYMERKNENRADKCNIYPVGVTDAEFREFCISYLIGEDWYVVDPLAREQVNEIALGEILEKYSRRFRKEKRKRKNGLRKLVAHFKAYTSINDATEE